MEAAKKFFIPLIQNLSKHDIFTLAAALAFYTALSLAPLLIIVVYLIGTLGFEAQNDLLERSQEIMGPQASKMIEVIITNIHNEASVNSAAGVFAMAFLFFSASGAIMQLQFSINTIWETKSDRSAKGEIWAWLKKRLFSLLFVLVFAAFVFASIIGSAVINFILQGSGDVLAFINFAGTFVIFACFFRMIFYYLPDEKELRPYTWYGGFLTALLFTAGKDLIGKYLGTSAVSSAYGTAGSFLILLMWVYYSSLILFIGAEVTRTLQLQKLKVRQN